MGHLLLALLTNFVVHLKVFENNLKLWSLKNLTHNIKICTSKT
jgi:hypothetical protein